MDQIYLSKNRSGMAAGTYVIIKPIKISGRQKIEKPYFYNITALGPIKLEIINKIFTIVENSLEKIENLIITGSFLEKGFSFNDIDIIIISEKEEKTTEIAKEIERELAVKAHIILLTHKELMAGLETDPLYSLMLDRCVAKKRLIYKHKRKIDYKLLDLHLLKSKTLIENFDLIDGHQKYDLTRNMVAIYLFIQNKKISYDLVNKEIIIMLNVESQSIKRNIMDKNEFLSNYKAFYNKTFSIILKNIKNGAK